MGLNRNQGQWVSVGGGREQLWEARQYVVSNLFHFAATNRGGGWPDSPTLTEVFPSSSEALLPPVLLLTLMRLLLRGAGLTMALMGRCGSVPGDVGGELAISEGIEGSSLAFKRVSGGWAQSHSGSAYYLSAGASLGGIVDGVLLLAVVVWQNKPQTAARQRQNAVMPATNRWNAFETDIRPGGMARVIVLHTASWVPEN